MALLQWCPPKHHCPNDTTGTQHVIILRTLLAREAQGAMVMFGDTAGGPHIVWSTVPILVPSLYKEWTATSPKAFKPSHKITSSVMDTAPQTQTHFIRQGILRIPRLPSSKEQRTKSAFPLGKGRFFSIQPPYMTLCPFCDECLPAITKIYLYIFLCTGIS